MYISPLMMSSTVLVAMEVKEWHYQINNNDTVFNQFKVPKTHSEGLFHSGEKLWKQNEQKLLKRWFQKDYEEKER